jgi:cyanophycinase
MDDPLMVDLVQKGTLALVGSGEYLPRVDLVDRYLLDQLSSPPQVVCLPTAAGLEGKERINYWSKLGEDHFKRLGSQVEALPVIDRASAEDQSLASRIRAANFVYLSGGKPDYLYHTLSGSSCWLAILSVLQGGGVVAGCSAGAMIFGERMVGFHNFQTTQPGFNGLPHGLILPHFDEIPAAMATLAHSFLPKGMVLVGIEGSTALVVTRGELKVVGSGGVTMWEAKRKRRLTQSDPAFTSLQDPSL